MKIVVLSDTHIRYKKHELPERVIQELQSADHIIHAGDWQIPAVYHTLQQYGDVTGVYGNVDGEEIMRLVPEKRVIEKNGWKIGIVHGHGDKKTTEKRAQEAFDEHLDIIVFGHSHIPLIRYAGKTMLFNPGSLLYKRKLPYCSFGIITLEEKPHVEHVFL
ncbi:putative phosphoesterase [Salibacterium salarium]|uniref:metallophosphoesterase family protein n=1 Tax=Salibacterium salarium TaxID=284579 RepID=UPI0027813305|nr:metallophosphoesterase family protein [Salibacterium salarium]MDQ0300643.1 putative phosphoesterase [Salibacterium salarium]